MRGVLVLVRWFQVSVRLWVWITVFAPVCVGGADVRVAGIAPSLVVVHGAFLSPREKLRFSLLL